jgi:hypothetical protein
MAITNRALAFATRWFDEATVRRTFEPLIADWQREWLDAPPQRRAWITVRASLAFICAVIVSSPQIALTPTPAEVTRRIAVRMVKFIAVATVVLMIPPVIELSSWMMRGASWVRGSLFLLAVPSALTLAFPFAMAGAVDALRRHQKLPGHVERGAVVKLGAFALMFMLVYCGWVVPAAGRAARTAMNPAGMSEPLRMMRDLTTYELVVDPARASVYDPGTYLASRSRSLKHELNQRAALMALPIVLLWLRWRTLNQPRKRWLAPLPEVAATAIAIATLFAFSYLGTLLERVWQLWPGISAWLPISAFAVWGLLSAYARRFLPDGQTEVSHPT